jgi:hypothetical protein
MASQMGCVVCNSPDCELLGQEGLRLLFNCEVCGRYNVSTSASRHAESPESYPDPNSKSRFVLSYSRGK